MDHTPRGGMSPDQWLDQFQQVANPGLRRTLASEEDHGTLQDMVLIHREDSVWASASFSMATYPGITFIWNQEIMPDLSTDWDPEFAAMLFRTHLIEWFHTKAKRQHPDAEGIIRS